MFLIFEEEQLCKNPGYSLDWANPGRQNLFIFKARSTRFTTYVFLRVFSLLGMAPKLVNFDLRFYRCLSFEQNIRKTLADINPGGLREPVLPKPISLPKSTSGCFCNFPPPPQISEQLSMVACAFSEDITRSINFILTTSNPQSAGSFRAVSKSDNGRAKALLFPLLLICSYLLCMKSSWWGWGLQKIYKNLHT